MNTLTTILGDIFKLIPYVVAGINVVHAGESTETKTQIATNVLGVATQAAQAVVPANDTATAQAVSNAVATGIASVQAVQNALNNTPAQ